MGWEIQDSGRYQPCRVFIKHTLAVEMTMNSVVMSSVKTQKFLGINLE